MQLFQLAKEQLKYIDKLVPHIAERAGSDAAMEDVDIPLLRFNTAGKPEGLEPGESRDFKGINLLVGSDPDGEIDLPAIEKGINDFVSRALLFAFEKERAARMPEDEAAMHLARDRDDEEKLYLRFATLKPDEFGVKAAGQALDDLDTLMFDGWKKVPGMQAPFYRKKFESKDDARKVESLIDALARAAGYTHDEIEQCFDVSPNDKMLTVNTDFLEQLAKVEQTLEAKFGRKVH